MGQYEGITRESCNTFVDMLGKQGWTLVTKLKVGGPFTAHDLDTGITLLDRHEYRSKLLLPVNKNQNLNPNLVEVNTNG